MCPCAKWLEFLKRKILSKLWLGLGDADLSLIGQVGPVSSSQLEANCTIPTVRSCKETFLLWFRCSTKTDRQTDLCILSISKCGTAEIDQLVFLLSRFPRKLVSVSLHKTSFGLSQLRPYCRPNHLHIRALLPQFQQKGRTSTNCKSTRWEEGHLQNVLFALVRFV